MTARIEIDPQAKVLLDQIAEHSAPSNADGAAPPETYAEQIAAWRAQYRATIPLAGKTEAVFKTEDRVISGAGGSIPIRIYTPEAGKDLPVLVYFHGGSLTAGDLDTHDTPLRALSNKSEFIIVSVAYRLAPENQYPAAIDDCFAALQWTSENAREINANKNLLAVGGDSAGGLLAAIVAQMWRDRKFSPPLIYQLLIYPNTDLTLNADYPSWRENDNLILNRDELFRGFDAYLPAGVDRRNSYVSPIYAESFQNLPPAFVVTGEADPQRDEGEAYARKLESAGVEVRQTRYPGMIHGFFQMAGAIDAGKQLIEEAAANLRSAAAQN